MNALALDDSSEEVSLSASPAPISPVVPRLMDRVRQVVRERHYALRTENAFIEWIHRFFAFFPGRNPETFTEADLRRFLEALAARPDLTPALRNQARSALLLFFHGVLGQRLNCTDGMGRTRPDGAAHVTLSPADVRKLLAAVDPAHALIVALLYGAGLRLSEALTLRVLDIDFENRLIHIRDERDHKPARCSMMPEALVAPLKAHLETARARHDADLAKGAGFATLPDEVRMSDPAAARSFAWQWLFVAGRVQRDPLSGDGRRVHQHEAVVVRALQDAARVAGLAAGVNAHTLRHAFSLHLVAAGVEVDVVQAFLGVGTISIEKVRTVKSPLDLAV